MKSLVKKNNVKAGAKANGTGNGTGNAKPAQCCAKTSKIIVGCHD